MLSFDLGKIVVSEEVAKKCLEDEVFFRFVKSCLVGHSNSILNKLVTMELDSKKYMKIDKKYPLSSLNFYTDCKVWIRTVWNSHVTEVALQPYGTYEGYNIY